MNRDVARPEALIMKCVPIPPNCTRTTDYKYISNTTTVQFGSVCTTILHFTTRHLKKCLFSDWCLHLLCGTNETLIYSVTLVVLRLPWRMCVLTMISWGLRSGYLRLFRGECLKGKVYCCNQPFGLWGMWDLFGAGNVVLTFTCVLRLFRITSQEPCRIWSQRLDASIELERGRLWVGHREKNQQRFKYLLLSICGRKVPLK